MTECAVSVRGSARSPRWAGRGPRAEAPYAWARGNGWLAASMKKLVNTEVAFRELPCRTHVTVLGPSYAIIRDFIRSHCVAPSR